MHTSQKSSRQANLSTPINCLLPAACRVSVSVFAAVLLMLGPLSSYAQVQVWEGFDSGLGNFTVIGGNNDGFDIGWKNTGWTGGSPGYIGGMFNRTNVLSPTAPNMPRILDTASYTIGGPLTTLMPIHASGVMYLVDPGNAGTDVNFGFWNSSLLDPSDSRLVMRIHSPADGGWRFRLADDQGSTSRQTLVGSDSKPLYFSFSFTPSGLLDGSGTLIGSVFDGATVLDLGTRNVGANTNSFDSFGVWADSASSIDFTQFQYMYFDNLTYTVVPEPVAALLLPLGVGLLVLTRRSLRRRA